MKILYHVSNPINRESIMKNGLIPKIGESYKAHYEEKVMGAVVFVKTTNDYDSTYNDDRYKITLSPEEYSNLRFLTDKEVDGGLFTFSQIPAKNIEIVHEGDGMDNF